MPPSFWAIMFALSVGWLIALCNDDTCPTENPVIYHVVSVQQFIAVFATGTSGIAILQIIWEAS